MNYITFDIETYDPNITLENINSSPMGGRIDTEKINVSVIGAYVSWIDQYLAFFEEDVVDFMNLMREADLIVGFNHLWFDIPVLKKYSSYDVKTLHCYDIMAEFEKKAGHRIKLDSIAEATLGQNKTDSYSVYRSYHLEGKWAELTDYCMHDVLITEKIFRLVLQDRPIMYKDMMSTRQLVLDKPSLKPTQVFENDELF
jgi:DNA polymerase elongation subunit (family B)